MSNLQELVGKTITAITGLAKNSEEVEIQTKFGKAYKFYHRQSCCESVELIDFDGEASDLIGAYITSAEEVSSDDYSHPETDYFDSLTWTFYKIETDRGGIFMRWLGKSNGWYSEEVEFEEIFKESLQKEDGK